MPSVSSAQHRLMEGVAHNPKFAKKMGIAASVGRDFVNADKKSGKYADGGTIPKLRNLSLQEIADAIPKGAISQPKTDQQNPPTPKRKPPVPSSGVGIGESEPDYNRGGRTRQHLKIGGDVLPDVLSGVGDIVGAFFGDPMAGDQGVAALSVLDNGRTGGRGVESQLLGQVTSGGKDQWGSGGNAGAGGVAGGASLASSFLKNGGLVPKGYADGGGVEEPSSYHGSGLFASLGSGRTDIHNRDVPPGGYVIPADVVSGLAEGNTLAGSAIIDKMMKTGPYGTKLPDARSRADFPREYEIKKPDHIPQQQQNSNTATYEKSGGITGKKHDHRPVPVVVAGGEHYVSPQDIEAKFGSLERGHKILDQWIIHRRNKNIKELKKLPGPKK